MDSQHWPQVPHPGAGMTWLQQAQDSHPQPLLVRPHHWARVVSKRSIEGFDVLELKHVPLDKGLTDLLVGPGYEELVVVVGLLCQARGEVNGGL